MSFARVIIRNSSPVVKAFIKILDARFEFKHLSNLDLRPSNFAFGGDSTLIPSNPLAFYSGLDGAISVMPWLQSAEFVLE